MERSMKSPLQLAQENPNASVFTVAGAFVTVASVLSDDLLGYDPSSPAFWPAVLTLVGAAVLYVGRRKT
jgi:hypothetical protein